MKPSNVLVICSDEHARAFSGCYGHTTVQTPALDQLAKKGTLFEQAYTPSPICVPARASLATGLQVHELGCWSSAEPYAGRPESWMHRVRDLGIPVVSFGKLHFRSAADDNGFTEEHIPMHAVNNGLGWPLALLKDPLPPFEDTWELAAQTGPGESDYTQYDRRITAKAVSWLHTYPAKLKDKPWVIFTSFVSPHYPLTAPKDFYELYRAAPLELPLDSSQSTAVNHPVIRALRAFWNYDDYFNDHKRLDAIRCYFGLVSFLDNNIRQLLKALEDTGNLDNTMILYLSDHGEMLGQFGLWTKSVMFERSCAIPMIAAGPGFAAPRCSVPVSLTDIGATVELALSRKSAASQQAWASQALQQAAVRNDYERFILSQYHDGGTPVSFYMIRHAGWKYVYYAGGHSPQLFNLASDPNELQDLSQKPEHRRCLEAMHAKLISILDPESTAVRCATDQARKLASLGGREKVLAMQSFNHTPVEV